MNKYSMTCTCGHTLTAEAADRESAVAQIKAQMDEAAIAQHIAEKHPGEPVPPVADIHAMIEQQTKEEAPVV